jgi:transcriptional regulator with XRE-family HTH domain
MGGEQDWSHRVRHQRELLGMTQEAYGRLLGTSARTIARWECGESVPQRRFQGQLLMLSLGLEDAFTEKPERAAEAVLDALQGLPAEVCERVQRALIDSRMLPAGSYHHVHPQRSTCRELTIVRRYFKNQQWQPLVDFGAFIPLDTLDPISRVRIRTSIGVAWSYLGEWEQAAGLFEQAEEECRDPEYLSVILCNQASILAKRAEKLREARDHTSGGDLMRRAHDTIREARRLDPANELAMYNAVAFACLDNEVDDALRTARELVSKFPCADSPEHRLGKAVLDDPDLAPLRRHARFAPIFPTLSRVLSPPPAARTLGGSGLMGVVSSPIVGLLPMLLLYVGLGGG